MTLFSLASYISSRLMVMYVLPYATYVTLIHNRMLISLIKLVLLL